MRKQVLIDERNAMPERQTVLRTAIERLSEKIENYETVIIPAEEKLRRNSGKPAELRPDTTQVTEKGANKMKITDHIEMLKLETSNGVIYPTLLHDENHLILVDTGFPGQTEQLKAAFAEAGFELERLTGIVATHQDIDHIGCAAELSGLAPNVEIMAHTEDAPYIDGSKPPVKLAALERNYDNLDEPMKAVCDNMKRGFGKCRVKIDRLLNDGDILPCCGGTEIIHSPGHTPGHICLFVGEARVLIAGDALNIKDEQLTGANPVHTLDAELARQSEIRLRGYPCNRVICYHGGVLKFEGEV
jgi:glyoxylase-like metal-dependent hydrolase (beta-lactamase superfamily II)